jgi:VWFA-related protein
VAQDFTRDRQAIERGIELAVTGGGNKANWPSRLPPEGSPSLLRNLPKGNDLRDRTTTFWDGMRVLAAAAKPLVGRKELVLLSTGFGEVNSFGQYVPDVRFYKPMAQALNDANVAVYAVDLLDPDTESPLSSSLSQIAEDTGGRYFQHLVNFVTPLQQISEATGGYYLLAYRATHPHGANGYQRVKVTVKNPDFRVKAREGYLFGQ